MSNPVLIVHDSALSSIQLRHPWLLGSSLSKTLQPISKDSVVDLVDSKQRFLGRGIFNPDSRIAVRVYSWTKDEPLDESFFRTRIHEAVELRKSRLQPYLSLEKVGRRLVFSEADRLSGLIVDAFGHYLVIQVTSSGVLARLPWVLQALENAWPADGMILQIDEATAEREGISPKHEVISGSPPRTNQTIIENEVEYLVDLLEGQKTGHYLDQRTNRLNAASWIPDGSKVLDVCCYSGGFACAIAKHNQNSRITAIDTSQKALDLASKNAELNGLSNIGFEQGDFYQALEKRIEAKEVYDAIVLDPPRMAGTRSQVQRALSAYHRLNLLAVRLLRHGGILVTCSCSGRVTREDFRRMIVGVSKRSGREIQILEQSGAADDHPTSMNCPETDYLKCFVCKIWR